MEERPKILFITPLPPPVHGSGMVSQYIKDSELLNKEFDMDFVNLSTSRSMAEIGKNSLWLYAKKSGRFMGSYTNTFWKLMTNHYDLCYLAITCHGVGFMKDMPFVLLCKMFGRKVVIHQHNKGMSADVDRVPYKWLMRFTYKNTKVILLSWRLYPDIEKVVKKEDVMICPNGIPPLKAESKESSNGLKSSKGVPRLLYLSNLIVSKGVYVLLDACKILKDKGIVFTCDFVGGESKEISREDFVTAVHERGLDDKVQYLGRKYGKDKVAEYQNSVAFVLPTMNDCLPLTIIEAMQQAIPTVSTDVGAVADLVEPMVTGLIAATNSPEDLAEKLQLLIDNKDLRVELGRNALKRYTELYSLEAFEKCLLTNLQNLVGGGDLSFIWEQIHYNCDISYVRYNGPKYGADKELLWNQADVFVLPTYYYNECFPLVLLEAMQHGVACISTEEGGIPDTIEDSKTG